MINLFLNRIDTFIETIILLAQNLDRLKQRLLTLRRTFMREARLGNGPTEFRTYGQPVFRSRNCIAQRFFNRVAVGHAAMQIGNYALIAAAEFLGQFTQYDRILHFFRPLALR